MSAAGRLVRGRRFHVIAGWIASILGMALWTYEAHGLGPRRQVGENARLPYEAPGRAFAVWATSSRDTRRATPGLNLGRFSGVAGADHPRSPV
jgi:hypothetical protein